MSGGCAGGVSGEARELRQTIARRQLSNSLGQLDRHDFFVHTRHIRHPVAPGAVVFCAARRRVQVQLTRRQVAQAQRSLPKFPLQAGKLLAVLLPQCRSALVFVRHAGHI